MPKILDLELSTPRFIARIIVAAILAGIDFFVFYVLISPNDTFLARFLPASVYTTLHNAMSSFVSPELPIIGILIAALIFLEQIFKGTRISGIFLVIMGALFSWYTYTFFQGGTMTFDIPSGLIQGVSGSATVRAYLLMWLFIAPSLLTILKGGLMLYTSNKKKRLVRELEPLTPIASR
jgi:hypothetical protein